MRKVILFPVGEFRGKKDGVSLNTLRRFLPPAEHSLVEQRAAGAMVHLFGRQEKDRVKWLRIEPDDLVFFSHGGRVHSVGRVVLATRNRELGEHRWPEEKYEGIWDHLILVADLRETNIPYAELNAASGDKPKYRPFGFRVMDTGKSAAVLHAFKL